MSNPPAAAVIAETVVTAASTDVPFVRLNKITKSFGPTLANASIDLAVEPGAIIGLVGGNGAGKSTLMRILCGVTQPTLGSIEFSGERVDGLSYNASAAQARGIRMVHQELSLCTNLSVAENFFVEAPEAARVWPGWRSLYRQRAEAALEVVFPASAIDVDQTVAELTIGERQMVEIARAAATPGVRLIILDEPTSSLGLERSLQLRAYIHAQAAKGIAFIFISHKLHEIIDISSDVLVLRNGHAVWRGGVADATVGSLVQLMGGDADTRHVRSKARETTGELVLRLSGGLTEAVGKAIELRRGEIVGLAGLEGSGQKQLPQAIFTSKASNAGIERFAKASFVAGDRQKDGVFPLWSVLGNISIGRIAPRPALSLVSDTAESQAATGPAARLQLDEGRFFANIGELSGGNQQKALVVRSLVTDAPIILLDDPTRGVDIATKQDFYRLAADLARDGRTLLWHTTEDSEFLACDRVLVFANGIIVGDLQGDAISEEAIVQASFAHHAGKAVVTETSRLRTRVARSLVNATPYVCLIAVLAIMMGRNPMIASVFGLDLLLMPAVALVLVTVAQMFVVGGSEIDLSVGAFAGLVSVLAATLLYDQPMVGIACMVGAIAVYALLGCLIQLRKIPAIVVTLGASFIWVGIGYSIQPTPGGLSPEWLMSMFSWSMFGLPTSVLLIAAIALIAYGIDRTPLGVVLRGFGNNPSAMARSGWSAPRYALIRYLIAAIFAAAAGLTLTAINTASDINSGNSFTLLSVAAVVMGGCALIGGIISPVGAVVGAVTLALIGALLGVLNVSSDFNAAMQGLVLIAMLALRSLVDRREDTQ